LRGTRREQTPNKTCPVETRRACLTASFPLPLADPPGNQVCTPKFSSSASPSARLRQRNSYHFSFHEPRDSRPWSLEEYQSLVHPTQRTKECGPPAPPIASSRCHFAGSLRLRCLGPASLLHLLRLLFSLLAVISLGYGIAHFPVLYHPEAQLCS
jgi:hypothetical protein